MDKIMWISDHFVPKAFRNDNGYQDIVNKLHGLTVILVMVALVTLPIGFRIIASINKTALGITTGSTEDTIVSSLGTIALAVIAMAFVGLIGSKKR